MGWLQAGGGRPEVDPRVGAVDLPAAVDPFLQVWLLGADRGRGAVSGVNDRVVPEHLQQGSNRSDDRAEVGIAPGDGLSH